MAGIKRHNFKIYEEDAVTDSQVEFGAGGHIV